MEFNEMFSDCCEAIIEQAKSGEDAMRLVAELVRRLEWIDLTEWESAVNLRKKKEEEEKRQTEKNREAVKKYEVEKAKKSADRKNTIILNLHIRSAQDEGREATLTLEEWNDAIKHFNGMCAYCKEEKYDVLEHFVPSCLGGGTTANNCVPACNSCNSKKSNLHPDELGDRFPITTINRIQEYLQSR